MYPASGLSGAALLYEIALQVNPVQHFNAAMTIWEQGIHITRDVLRRRGSLAKNSETRSSSSDIGYGDISARLALYLWSMCGFLNGVGLHIDAIEFAQESVKLRRELFEANPKLYRADLATSLHSLGVSLNKAGRYGDASEANREAVKLRRELLKSYLDLHRTSLASSLHELNFSLDRAGRYSDAMQVNQESVKLQQELYDANPNTHRAALLARDLAISLRYAERIADAEEAESEADAVPTPPIPGDVSLDLSSHFVNFLSITPQIL